MFLFPHLGTMIWITLIFLIVLFFLTKFAWKPLLKAIEKRESTIESSLNAAKEADLKIAQLESEQKSIVELARQEKLNLMKEGVEQRDKIIQAAQIKAREEADRIIEEAKKKIEMEKDAAISDVKSQIAFLSVEIASKIIRSDLEDKSRHEKLVNDIVKDVELN